MIKKVISFLVVLLVLLEYVILFEIPKEEKPIPSKKEKAIRIVCKDDYLTTVFANSKYPYLLTAIAKVESDYKPQVRGDHGKSFGLYQIQSRYWGIVPDSVEGQTRHAERILECLIRKHGVSKAVERYNGSGRDARRYRQKVFLVMNQLKELERIV